MTKINRWTDYTDDQNEIIGAYISLIKNTREELGLSVRELGTKAGVSYTVIYDLENKNILPKMETINKLANALDLSIDVKVSRSGKEPMLNILYCKMGNEKAISKRVGDSLAHNWHVTKEEQLKVLLSKYGLYTNEITEIESFIKFKLSQH